MAMLDSDFYDSPDTTSTMEFEWGKEDEFYVEAEIIWECVGHDGIGDYEYWGSKCYDKGDPVFEIAKISFTLRNEEGDEIIPTPEMDTEIRDFININAEPDF